MHNLWNWLQSELTQKHALIKTLEKGVLLQRRGRWANRMIMDILSRKKVLPCTSKKFQVRQGDCLHCCQLLYWGSLQSRNFSSCQFSPSGLACTLPSVKETNVTDGSFGKISLVDGAQHAAEPYNLQRVDKSNAACSFSPPAFDNAQHWTENRCLR